MKIHRVMLTCAVLPWALGCGSTGESGAEPVGELESAIVGVDTYLYLRCNATSWQPVPVSRFRNTGAPGEVELTFDVNESWMVSSGDQCQLTETNQLDGWGTSQQSYGLRSSPLVVPGAGQLQSGGGQFQIRYPSLGRYTARANLVQGSLLVQAASVENTWLPKANVEVSSIASSSRVAGVTWVAYEDGTIYRTSSAEQAKPSWSLVSTFSTSAGTFSLPAGQIRDLALLPVVEDQALVGFAGNKQGTKLWISGPGGRSWVEVGNFPLAQVGEILSVSVSPLDGRAYVTGLSGSISGSISGSTWTPASAPDPLRPAAATGAVSTVNVAHESPDQLWVGTTHGEIFLSFDRGVTWTKVSQNAGLPASAVVDLALNAQLQPPEVYATFAGLQTPDRVWRSANGGQTWLNVHGNLPTSAAPPTLYSMGAISINPADTAVLYATYTFEESRSGNRGASWSN